MECEFFAACLRGQRQVSHRLLIHCQILRNDAGVQLGEQRRGIAPQRGRAFSRHFHHARDPGFCLLHGPQTRQLHRVAVQLKLDFPIGEIVGRMGEGCGQLHVRWARVQAHRVHLDQLGGVGNRALQAVEAFLIGAPFGDRQVRCHAGVVHRARELRGRR